MDGGMKVKLRLSISSRLSNADSIVKIIQFPFPSPSPREFRGPMNLGRAYVRPAAPRLPEKSARGAYYSNSPVKRNEYLMLPDLHISWGGGPHRSRDADRPPSRPAANRLIINRRVSDRPSLARARARARRHQSHRRFSAIFA